MKHIAVLTSGGDAPGMNAAIRAVTRSALDEGMTVSGVLQGWQGLVDGQFRQLSARDVGGIIQVGGTFLGSARSAEFPEESGRSKALRNLAQRGIDGGVAISSRSVRQHPDLFADPDRLTLGQTKAAAGTSPGANRGRLGRGEGDRQVGCEIAAATRRVPRAI